MVTDICQELLIEKLARDLQYPYSYSVFSNCSSSALAVCVDQMARPHHTSPASPASYTDQRISHPFCTSRSTSTCSLSEKQIIPHLDQEGLLKSIHQIIFSSPTLRPSDALLDPFSSPSSSVD
ncbi:unnamed protein product [Leuciscus chuanchicus]